MHPKSLSFKWAVALLLFPLLVCSSCATHQTNEPQSSYYTLEYAPPVFSGLPVLNTTLRVASFDTAPEFDTDRMVYRPDKYTLATYPYRAWMAKPAAQVRYFLERDLQRSGLLTAVLSDTSRLRPAYLLGGSVDKFLEIDEAKNWEAELSLSIILQRMPSSDGMAKVLGQRQYTVRKICVRKNPRAVAEAMSQAMAELSKEIQQDIYAFIKNDLAKRAGG